MGEIAINLLRWTVKLAFVLAAITAFIVILNFALSMISVQLNQNVLSDVFALIQIWLPFNLNVLTLWLLTASSAYLMYKLSVMTIAWINRFIGQ